MRKGWAVVAAVVLGLGLTACQADGADPVDSQGGNDGDASSTVFYGEPGPWHDEFKRLFDEAESEFLRGIFADGVLTEAEVTESLTRSNECLELAGLPEIIDPDTGMVFNRFLPDGSIGASTPHEISGWVPGDPPPTRPESEQAIIDQCAAEFGGGLAGLYSSIEQNPDNADFTENVVACLHRKGLAPSGFTAEDLWASMEARWPIDCDLALQDERLMNVVCNEDGTVGSVTVNPDFDDPGWLLPNGVSMDEGPGFDCWISPNL